MVKVITYGTYDLLHKGHIRLLERAKALGDYLIVGVTADSFDLSRGKINVQQSLIERIEAVRSTGIADEIIVEEYEGQKIDDVKRYDVDIFAIGSDWKGRFDYLDEYCDVVYLDRTKGISSTDIRTGSRMFNIGVIGESTVVNKFVSECAYVNGINVAGLCCQDLNRMSQTVKTLPIVTRNYGELLQACDAVYVISHPSQHYNHVKKALLAGKHVLCESPIALSVEEWSELKQLAKEKNLHLVDSLKTAYSTAFNRMLLLVKSGIIGDVKSVDATCTSLSDLESVSNKPSVHTWNSICAWGPTALLPIFQLLGVDYSSKQIISHMLEEDFDAFSKIDFLYPAAVASLKVGKGVKSEGGLIVSGTKGYIYVPSPWWKTDYFEVRFEKQEENKRYFYQLDGEGIRYEILSFLKSILNGKDSGYIDDAVSMAIVGVVEDFYDKKRIEIG